MRLARLVAVGLLLGGVVGFLTALLRRRAVPVPAPPSGPVGPVVPPAGGDGSDLPTRPFPLPIQPAMAGTGGSR